MRDFGTPKKESNELVFGIRAVIEAITAGKEIESLFIQKGLTGNLYAELRLVIGEYDTPFQFVPIEKLNRLTTKNHQGAVAFISPISYHKTDQIVPEIYAAGKTPLLLVLDRVTDVRNFGAIVRTAECMGVDAVIVPARGSAQVNPDAIKTSAGALFRVPICREMKLKETLEFLKDSGVQLVACTEKTDNLLADVDYTGPTAIIMGSEEDGISPEYMKFCDARAKIPMFGDIASLNVSVSAGVILYEAIRQRKV
ncbi:23S rRNA (guanosine(2251)-2'-O)-methyltransferase RlmB [Solitalea sp. MAHUQ-68]|uniref:23S rRNA (Guanosine(2251)-2'-O)-methyltransferase RlmB n=1 Tax=Solitalea agri TaxID=2953739 RepID=A0A9X2EZP0_9SPHI|nr:23S rRNA (guanosine(2251)-2'-O)-methyltransferase RlmB [Solitalea agri]MCO4291531.1 23S rRNA (guanosine(2251)-2'-O)-methyltransferase RlmB [Solitalea agri]